VGGWLVGGSVSRWVGGGCVGSHTDMLANGWLHSQG
jgi:hypothetical protein